MCLFSSFFLLLLINGRAFTCASIAISWDLQGSNILFSPQFHDRCALLSVPVSVNQCCWLFRSLAASTSILKKRTRVKGKLNVLSSIQSNSNCYMNKMKIVSSSGARGSLGRKGAMKCHRLLTQSVYDTLSRPYEKLGEHHYSKTKMVSYIPHCILYSLPFNQPLWKILFERQAAARCNFCASQESTNFRHWLYCYHSPPPAIFPLGPFFISDLSRNFMPSPSSELYKRRKKTEKRRKKLLFSYRSTLRQTEEHGKIGRRTSCIFSIAKEKKGPKVMFYFEVFVTEDVKWQQSLLLCCSGKSCDIFLG